MVGNFRKLEQIELMPVLRPDLSDELKLKTADLTEPSREEVMELATQFQVSYAKALRMITFVQSSQALFEMLDEGEKKEEIAKCQAAYASATSGQGFNPDTDSIIVSVSVEKIDNDKTQSEGSIAPSNLV